MPLVEIKINSNIQCQPAKSGHPCTCGWEYKLVQSFLVDIWQDLMSNFNFGTLPQEICSKKFIIDFKKLR